MKVDHLTWLVAVVTVCICTFLWGTVAVIRLVPDNNYHAPAQKTAEEQKLEVFKKCMNDVSGSTDKIQDSCKKVAGVN